MDNKKKRNLKDYRNSEFRRKVKNSNVMIRQRNKQTKKSFVKNTKFKANEETSDSENFRRSRETKVVKHTLVGIFSFKVEWCESQLQM